MGWPVPHWHQWGSVWAPESAHKQQVEELRSPANNLFTEDANSIQNYLSQSTIVIADTCHTKSSYGIGDLNKYFL